MQEVGSDERVKLLQGVWLFERCTESELAAVAHVANPVSVESGRVLATEGTPGEDFVVVIEGTASATSRGEEVGQIGPGSFFGELALLDGGPRSATVRALTPMALLVLDRSAFDDLVDRAIPSVARRMLATLAGRVRAEQLRSERLHARRLSLPSD
jgi:CRP/FNR family transcriptional regulator, cyclic AMP receptor protein